MRKDPIQQKKDWCKAIRGSSYLNGIYDHPIFRAAYLCCDPPNAGSRDVALRIVLEVE